MAYKFLPTPDAGKVFSITTNLVMRIGEVSFNGNSTSYVMVADSPSLRLTNALTIEMWVKRRQLQTEDYLVNKGGDWTAGTLNYGVTIPGANFAANSNSLTFNFAGGTRHSGTITDFNWHHIAVVARNGDADPTFYIDGVPQPVTSREGSATLNLQPSTDPLYIGAQVDPGYYARAAVDEPAIYNCGLSSNDVYAIYSAGSAGKQTTNLPPSCYCSAVTATNGTFSVQVYGHNDSDGNGLPDDWEFTNFGRLGVDTDLTPIAGHITSRVLPLV